MTFQSVPAEKGRSVAFSGQPNYTLEDADSESVIRKIFGNSSVLLLFVVAYLDRINIGFAALQMRRQLRFSDETYGLGSRSVLCGPCHFLGTCRTEAPRRGSRRHRFAAGLKSLVAF